MTRLYSTDEAEAISNVPRPTINRYAERGLIDPDEAGGGRGKQNKYWRESVAWLIGLYEVLNVNPNVNARVYLWESGPPDFESPDPYGSGKWAPRPVRLKEGRKIQDYIRRWVQSGGAALAIQILCCYRGLGPALTKRRFWEIYIGPMSGTLALLNRWKKSEAPITYTDRGTVEATIASVCVINLNQLLHRVDSEANRL